MIKCFDQGHNTVPLMRLEPGTFQSLIVHITTESLHSSSRILLNVFLMISNVYLMGVLCRTKNTLLTGTVNVLKF